MSENITRREALRATGETVTRREALRATGETVTRWEALRDMALREGSCGRANVFSIRYVNLRGESVYHGRCRMRGESLRQRVSDQRRRNVQPCDEWGRATGHAVSVSIDLITEFNGRRVRE